MNCKHERTVWKDYLTIYESFQFLQCVDCGKVLMRKNVAKGMNRRSLKKGES